MEAAAPGTQQARQDGDRSAMGKQKYTTEQSGKIETGH